MNLLELVRALALENIPVCNSGHDDRGMYFEVSGFAKSGNVKLYEHGKHNALCVARYDEETIVQTVDDLAKVAWRWYTSWCDTPTFSQPSPIWQKKFIQLGLLEEVTILRAVAK